MIKSEASQDDPEALAEFFKKAWEEVAAEQSAKDAFFKKVWDDFSEFRKSYALWQSYGFLPRPEAPK